MPEPRRSRVPVMLRALGRVILMSFRIDPWRALAVMALTILTAVSFPIVGIALKGMVDAVGRHDQAGVIYSAGLLGFGRGFLIAAAFPQFVIMSTLNEKVAHHIDRQIVDLTSGIPGLEHHERPEYADKVQLLTTQRYLIGQPAFALFQGLSALLQLAATVLVLGRVHPLLLLVPIEPPGYSCSRRSWSGRPSPPG